MKKHLVLAAILTAVLTAALVMVFIRVSFVPPEASKEAIPIDSLMTLMFAIAAFFIALVLVFMLYSVIVFRRKKGDDSEGPPVTSIPRLELAWTLIPLGIVLWLGIYGGIVLKDMTRPQPVQDLEVHVIASQWSWSFEYPAYGITAAELVLPVNQPVLFKETSKDVVHSFWVPEFRVKQDILPGLETHVRLTPSRIGQYNVECAALCGIAHAFMVARVSVVSQSDFQAWVQQQQKR